MKGFKKMKTSITQPMIVVTEANKLDYYDDKEERGAACKAFIASIIGKPIVVCSIVWNNKNQISSIVLPFEDSCVTLFADATKYKVLGRFEIWALKLKERLEQYLQSRSQ